MLQVPKWRHALLAILVVWWHLSAPGAACSQPGKTYAVWSGSESLSGYGKLTFEFWPGGRAVMCDNDGVSHGTWNRHGNYVFLSFHHDAVRYNGFMSGRKMSGRAYNGESVWKWQVSLERHSRWQARPPQQATKPKRAKTSTTEQLVQLATRMGNTALANQEFQIAIDYYDLAIRTAPRSKHAEIAAQKRTEAQRAWRKHKSRQFRLGRQVR